MLYILIAIFSGTLISIQSTCNGFLYPFLGVVGVGFAAQFLCSVTGFVAHLICFHRPPRLKGLPLHACLGGICATFVLGVSGYLVTQVGTAVTVCLSVAGQLILSAFVDHFGWFSSQKVLFRMIRIPGFLFMMIGILVINLAGADGPDEVSGSLFLLLLLALVCGGFTVFSRLFNYKASQYVGKLSGCFANGLAGAVAGFVVFFILCKGKLPLMDFVTAPWYGYISGPLGILCAVLSTVAYGKLKTLHATVFLIIGQISAGILLDLLLYGSFSFIKLIGISLVCGGIFLDKKCTARQMTAEGK